MAVEFSTPDAARRNVEALIEVSVPVVCGTTGWPTDGVAELAADRGVGVLVAANFSIGVAALRLALAHAAALLRTFAEFEPGILERHHAAKRDAPSGTARALAETLAECGYRDVPIAVLRQGGQPGEHTVVFEGAHESLSIHHQVRSRSVFAAGAVRAAEWLVQQRPSGLVTFEQVLERMAS